MIKMIAALAMARDQVDRAIALGEAVPRLERARTIMLVGLLAAVILLSIGYINVTNQINRVKAEQVEAEVQRETIIVSLEHADVERDTILRLLAGKSGARQTSAP